MTSDRIAIVTGASAGIGAALVRLLLARGWTVIGISRRTPASPAAGYVHVACDLADHAALEGAMTERVSPTLAEARWTRVGLVNNAADPTGLMPLERLTPAALTRVYAVNVIAPIWLMGFVARTAAPAVAVRVANVSSGAAVRAFPGLGAYGSSKAALRMAGMVLASEWDSAVPGVGRPADASVLSYEPAAVDTDMQVLARAQEPEVFPWVGMFLDFAARGVLVQPAAPAAELVEYLESERQPRFAERRLGR